MTKPTLRIWSRGQAVRDLQHDLNSALPLSQPALAEDGVFGPKTEARVKEFQGLANVKADGVAGPITWGALLNVLTGVLQLAGPVAQQLAEVNPLRLAVARVAWEEWMYHGALVHAKNPGGKDPKNGRTFRQGYQYLMDYFSTAAPQPGAPGSTAFGDDNVTYLPSWFGQKPGDTLKAWCGIFALWAFKRAGLPVGNWVIGSGISSVSGFVGTDTPRKGDIAYRVDYQHHAVVYDVLKNEKGQTKVITIDGNSGWRSSITRNEGDTKSWTSFYRCALYGL